MKTLKCQIQELSSSIFEIESQLPMFDTFGDNSNEQEFRRELYRFRIECSRLQNYAELIDESKEEDFPKVRCDGCWSYECNGECMENL